MKRISRIQLLLLIAIALFVTGNAFAKPWRDIIPLHSTRADVERILKVQSTGTGYDSFIIDGYLVEIRYVMKSCDQAGEQMWNVPVGTVTSVWVTPKGKMSFSELDLDLSRFKVSYTDVSEVLIYTDDKEGFKIEAGNDRISIMYFYGTDKDHKLKCPVK